MNDFDQLMTALGMASANLDMMIQNAESSEKKEDVKNEDKKDEEIKNLLAKIANLEERLKNAEGEDEDKKVENIAKRVINMLRNACDKGKDVKNSDKDDEDVKNKGVRNTDKDDDKRIANILARLSKVEKEFDNDDDKKEDVKNSDKDDEDVKNKGVRNTDKDDDKRIANILARLSKVEKELDNDDDKKEDVKNSDKEDEDVKNTKVKNKSTKNLAEPDAEDTARGMGTNRDDQIRNKSIHNMVGVLADLTNARQQAIGTLIDTIVLNSGGVYSKEDLNGKTLNELQKLLNAMTKNSVPIMNASHSNIRMDPAICNTDAALVIPSTFPTVPK